MTGLPPTNFFRRPAVIGWLVFFILITAMGALSYQRYLLFKEARKGVLTNAAMNARDKLKATLDYSATATRTLAFIIDRNAGNINFDTVAKRLLDNYRFVDALELVEGGTITRIYPLAPNAAAIGYDILKDTLVNKEAERAIKEKKLFYAGPIRLRQGYVAVVGRQPIFSEGKFWGFSAAIVKLSTLITAAELDSGQNKDFVFQLSKIDPNTGEERFFLKNAGKWIESDWVSVAVAEGDWKIYARFVNRKLVLALLPFFILGILFSASGGLFAWYGARQPYRLRQLVEEKTRQLKVSEERYFSFFDKASDTIIVTNSQGVITEVNNSVCKLLGYTREELIGKNFSDLVEPAQLATDPVNLNFHQQEKELVRERRLVKKNGDIVELEINMKKIDGDNNLAIGRDLTGLREAQKQLVISESTLRGAFEHSAMGMALVSPEGKWFRVNKALCDMLGYSPEELKDMHFKEITHEEDREEGIEFMKEAMHTDANVYRAEKRYIKKGGDQIWVNLNVSSVRDARGQLLYFVTQTEDITEKKKLTEQLQVREEQLRLFIEYSPAALAMFDRDMRYLITSKRWLSDYGLDGKQVIGQIHYDLFPDNPQRWRDIHQQCLQGQSAKSEEDSYVDRQGNTIWLRWEVHPWRHFNGDIGGIILFTEIITQLKEAEIKFRNLVEKSLAGVYILRDGKVLYINPAHQKIMGYSLQELQQIGNVEALVHEADIPVYRANQPSAAGGNNSSQYRLRAIRKDGALVYLEVTTSEIMFEGKPALIGTMLDITAQVEEEKRISRAVNEAQERERMQIGMELHDNVKQIMAAALITVDFIKDHLSNAEIARESLNNLKEYTKEAIDELRRLSHQLAPEVDKTESFREQVENLVATMKAANRFTLNIEVPNEDTPLPLEVRTAFYRILQEQLNNIIKHAHAKSVYLQMRSDPSEFVLSIRDDGRGFIPSLRSEGIGLENIRRRAFVLGGTTTITSSPGQGCEVRVSIPAKLS